MKPVSKVLLCGILATSFVLINCQKAPSRQVKPGTGDGKVTPTALIPACSAEASAAIDARSTLKADIESRLAPPSGSTTIVLDAPNKVAVQAKIEELKDKSDAAGDKIRALSANDAIVEGCKQTQGANTRDVKLADLRTEDITLAQKVKTATGNDNKILKAAAARLAPQKLLSVLSKLADMLSKQENYNGNKAVYAGDVIEKAQYDAIKNDAAKTSCIIAVGDNQAVAAQAQATIVSLAQQSATKAELAMNIAAAAGGRLVKFNCKIAQGKDMADEMTAAFGTLLNPMGSAPPVDGGSGSTSGTPGVSGSPVVSGTPGVSDSPVVSGTPGVSDSPIVSGTPSVSDTPVVSGTPGVSETSAAALDALLQRLGN